MTTMMSVVPIVPGRDLAATTAWYRDHLGFRVRHIEDEYAIIERDDVELHFWGPSGIRPEDSMTMCRVGVRGIGALYEACSKSQIVHPNAPLDRKPWGTSEFAVTATSSRSSSAHPELADEAVR